MTRSKLVPIGTLPNRLKDLGASADADQALVASDQAASRLAPPGFDPSRICGHCDCGLIGGSRCLACHGTGFMCNACDPVGGAITKGESK